MAPPARRASSSKDEFLAQIEGKFDDDWLKPYLDALIADPPKVATRKASEMALEVINTAISSTIGGSADLTGSNNTKTKSQAPLIRRHYGGRYVYYGIREFGMAAAMNGMALHGGVMPYGGTFLVFADYCRAAIRLSALQNARVIYVMTHDSIGLGEDGPTHQPIEHLQSLRLIPNLTSIARPTRSRPPNAGRRRWRARGRACLRCRARTLPPVRTEAMRENLSARGAYRLKEANAARKVILIATGSEVEIAVEVAERLEHDGIGADVVSMPSTDRFDAQDEAYREDILPDVSNRQILRVSIEAGTTFGWERYTGLHGLRIGLDRFGASAPAPDLYKHFGLTADAIIPKIVEKLNR